MEQDKIDARKRTRSRLFKPAKYRTRATVLYSRATRTGRTYKPNGSRECARRMMQNWAE